MSEGLNKVMLLGQLGATPELRFGQSGGAILNMRLATTEKYKDRENNLKERTDWHSVVIFGNRAEALSKILDKGSSIFVEGRIQTSSYDDRDGNKKYRTEIIANNIILTGSRGRSEGAQDSGAPAGRGSGTNGGGYGGSRSGGGGSGGGRPRNPAPPPDDFGDFGGGNGNDDDIPF